MSADGRLQGAPSTQSQETRLRSSCDRCHTLKNRCARVGGPDSRCERCERLDINCVYSANARIGRPPGAGGNKTVRDRKRDGKLQRERNPRPTKRQTPNLARQRERGEEIRHLHVSPPPDDSEPDFIWAQQASSCGSNNEPADKAPSTSTELEHISNSQNAITFDKDRSRDPSVPVTSPFYGIHSCIDMSDSYPDPFALSSLRTDDLSPLLDWDQPEEILVDTRVDKAAHPFSRFERLLSNPSPVFLEQMLAPSQPTANEVDFQTPDLFSRLPDRPVPLHEQLLQLQNHLGGIVAKYHDAQTPHNQVPDDEALSATKSLLDITQSFLSLGSHQDHLPAVLRRSSNSLCHVGILQLLTCYTYLLQILEPTVMRLAWQISAKSHIACTSLHCQPQSSDSASSGPPSLASSNGRGANLNGNPGEPITDLGTTSATLQLGSFSFASQPALGAELLLRSIYHMIAQLHNNVNLLALGRGGMTDDMEQQVMDESNEDAEAEASDKTHQGPKMAFQFNPVIRSARAVMTVTHTQKRALFQRMNDFVDNSIRPGAT